MKNISKFDFLNDNAANCDRFFKKNVGKSLSKPEQAPKRVEKTKGKEEEETEEESREGRGGGE